MPSRPAPDCRCRRRRCRGRSASRDESGFVARERNRARSGGAATTRKPGRAYGVARQRTLTHPNTDREQQVRVSLLIAGLHGQHMVDGRHRVVKRPLVNRFQLQA